MVSVIQLSACGDGTEPPDPPRPATVTVSPATAELTALAATVQLMAEVLDQYGQVMAGAAVTWTSSGAAVATADASGLVTAADNGTATIKATAGEASGSATVTVAQKVSLVAVSPPADTVVERDTLRLSAEAMDANGHAVAEAEFTWASSDTLVAVVDDSGLVTGEAAGDVEVMATSSGLTGRAVLLVEAPVPTTVAVVPDSVSLAALGDTARLAAEVRDQIGRVMEGEAVSWTSGDTLVAAVDSVGLVMAIRNGVAAITARAGSASGSAAASVMQQARSVTVLPSSDTVALGDTARMAAEAFDENGYTVVDAAFTWSSSDTSVAPVDSLGLVRGIGEGVAAITATAGSAGGNATITVANPDRATLEVLFHAMDGPNWASSDNWLTDRPLSAWYGVRTGSGRVTHLQLIENNLSGPVPPELGDLTRLTYLQLDGNNLSDSIPPELGSLGGLAYLNLSKNRLTGSIPAEFAKLDALWNLDLAENGLTGSIPAELGSLDGLSILCLDGNNLTGSIPPELGSLESLHSLCLQHNNLTGSIPPKLGGLDGLSYLNLSWNALTGEIPPELGSLDGLGYLNLSQNGLTGSIPPEIGALGLGNLDLSGNNLTGPIPPELGGLTRLVYLVLYSNGLTGSIPSEFGNLTGLDKLYLGGNNLTGPIPTELGNLASLEVLSLHSNKLQGAVPLELSNLASLTSLNLGGNNLTGAIPAELGNLANLDRLVLWSNHLTGWIPPELGNLVNLTTLALGRNRLAGTIPPEFGHLTRLKRLYLDDTELTGTIPSTLLDLAELELVDFDGSAGLCVQGIVHFVAWWEKIADRRGAYCNASDAGVLEVLYRSLGGRHWTNSNRWLQTPALGEWHGVTADSLGRVLTLDLSRNALSGQLAPELGKLEVMTRLRIGDNSLSGRLPLSLARLTLSEFHYADTRLCVPVEAEFQAWLSSIASHAGTGMECGPLSDHDVLVALYFATGGWNWQESDNWLTQVPLEEWYGVGTDSAGRVTYLSLGGNELAGEIPRELGGLTNLRDLYLSGNQLTGEIPRELGGLGGLESLSLWANELAGEIPRELGGLTNLRVLRLSGNQLTGEIPPELGGLGGLESLSLWANELAGEIPRELGGLTNLQVLSLGDNQLTGEIPRELGGLTNLRDLYLGDNQLTGEIPRELGGLTNLRRLYLSDNALSGEIPPQLGGLTNLRRLYLGDNELSGEIPPQLGGLANLRSLWLSDNAKMSGPVPMNLTDLRHLELLLAGATDLCAPLDPGFQDWLATVTWRRIAPCGTAHSMAYLTQAVQSREYPVPLVAREEALLRVFVTAFDTTIASIPRVVARFYLDGTERHVVDIPGKSTPIPTEVDEGDLSESANADIPAEVVRPGLEMVIEIDPDGMLDPQLGVKKRIPETGRMAVNVQTMPLFDLTLIPFLWSTNPDSAVLDLTAAMARDPEAHDLLHDARTLLPVGALDVKAREPVLTSSNSAYALIAETRAIRVLEGGTGHYMGMMSGAVTGARGVAVLGGRSSFSVPIASVIAHELGHNMKLFHAPCGNPAFVDAGFPYSDGSIGAWGYDFRDGGYLVAPATRDLMSYCRPKWISDYHFSNALRFRLADEATTRAEISTVSTKSLLLWGGVDAEGELFLNPALVVEAPPSLPDSVGDHWITGRTSSGRALFSFGFAMPVVADSEGASSFAFALPVRPDWAASLASVTLSGPGGTATLDADTDHPIAILRDPRTGQVRGFLRGQAAKVAAQDTLGRHVDVLSSQGIPAPSAWKR